MAEFEQEFSKAAGREVRFLPPYVISEDQAFVKDDSVSVKKHVEAVGKEIGDNLSIRRYARFNIGA